MFDTIKSAWKTKNGKILVGIAGLVAFCFGCLMITSIISPKPEPMPQADVQGTAEAMAWLSVTQTQAAMVTVTPISTATPAPTIMLTLDPRLDGDNLFIEGTTDLPDGALISYSVQHEQYLTNFELPADQLYTEGIIEVANGIYSTQVDLSAWLAGNLEIWTAFQTILGDDVKQPPELVARFGELGELLQGDNVNSSTSMKRVELIKTLSFIPSTPAVLPTTVNPLFAPKSNGFYLVNIDIAPGVWRSTGTNDGCYWATTTQTGDIIDNHFGMSGGTAYISTNAFQVEFNRCGTWEYLGGP